MDVLALGVRRAIAATLTYKIAVTLTSQLHALAETHPAYRYETARRVLTYRRSNWRSQLCFKLEIARLDLHVLSRGSSWWTSLSRSASLWRWRGGKVMVISGLLLQQSISGIWVRELGAGYAG